jgi:hypothetical protein
MIEQPFDPTKIFVLGHELVFSSRFAGCVQRFLKVEFTWGGNQVKFRGWCVRNYRNETPRDTLKPEGDPQGQHGQKRGFHGLGYIVLAG